MKKIINIILASALICSFCGVALSSNSFAVGLSDPVKRACDVDPNSAACVGDNDIASLLKKVIKALMFVIGAIAVLYIILAGIDFVTSNGEPNKIAKAKNTIMYSIIGVIVAVMSYSIVDFVIDALLNKK